MPPNEIPAARMMDSVTVRYETGRAERADRAVPVETPINIVYAPVPFAVMMATPADLEDFAVGFSFTESIIDRPEDIRDIAIENAEGGLRIVIGLASDKMQRHLARKRAIAGRTGCGLCGIDDLASLPRAETRLSDQRVAIAAVQRAVAALDRLQPLNAQTRAVHAAAFADLHGDILVVREDVGRHNALDKAIGALLREKIEPSKGFFVITSRCSFEMVEKAAACGAHTIVAISAPTSLAVERAQSHGMTLVAVARGDSAMIFTAPERVLGASIPDGSAHS